MDESPSGSCHHQKPVLACGENSVRFRPSLVATDDDVNRVTEALGRVAGRIETDASGLTSVQTS